MSSKYHWILDNGHGGMIKGVYQTPGKRSPKWPDGRQLFEGEFNRDVVNRISEQLTQLGIEHTVLVPSQNDIPLGNRVNLANAIHNKKGNTVLVSVHANAGGGSGYEVYTSVGETKADKFATVFFNEMKKLFPNQKFRTDTFDGDVDKEAQFFILKRSWMPAILTENFFMDTLDPDCEILMSNKGRQLIADAHVNAILYAEKNIK